MVKKLRLAAELQQAGMGTSQSITASIVYLQIQIHLLLANCLDDIEKDLLVNHLSSTLDSIIRDPRKDTWLPVAAICIGLVEDALVERVASVWAAYTLSTVETLSTKQMALHALAPMLRRYAMYHNKRWSISCVTTIEDCAFLQASFGARLYSNGNATSYRVLSSSSNLDLADRDSVLVLPCHLIGERYVAFAVNDNVASRVVLTPDDARLSRKDATGAVVLPIIIRSSQSKSVSLERACVENLGFTIEFLKFCLENKYWLPHYNHQKNIEMIRNAIYEIMTAELLDSFEVSIGFLTCKQNGFCTELCSGFLRIAHVAIHSIGTCEHLSVQANRLKTLISEH